MPIREIKTRLALDGEQAFNRAIKEVDRNLRAMKSEMAAAASEYDLTGDKQAYLTSKSRLLKDEIAQQQAKIEALNDALRTTAGTYGEADARTDRYRIQISNATTALNKMQLELRQTGTELDNMGTDVQESVSDLDDLKTKLDDISFNTGVSALKSGWDMASGAFESAIGLADSTRELRRTMAVLEQNANTAGVDFTAVKTELNNVASLTGDMESAVEGMSTLLATGFDSTNLTTAIELLSGAAITFKDTLSFEGLSESLQETIGSDTATGQFAELIERMGGDLEAFNAAMAAAPDDAAQMQLAMDTLKGMGLADVTAEFTANNQAMIDAEAAAQRWETAMSGLGGVMDQVLTPIRNSLAGLIEDTTAFMQMALDGGLTGNSEAYMNWANEQADKKIKWQIENDIEVVEIPVSMETTELREQLAALDAQINEAWTSGDNRTAHMLEAERAVLFAQITALETELANGGKEAGNAAIEAADKAIEDGAAEAEKSAGTVGKNIGTELGNGMAEMYSYAVEQAAMLADGMIAELIRVAQTDITPTLNKLGDGLNTTVSAGKGDVGAVGSAGGLQAAITVVTNLDGKTIARETVNYIDQDLGERSNA